MALALLLLWGFQCGAEPMNSSCKKEYFIDRSHSPWQGYTADYNQEQEGKKISAVKITPEMERVPHLAGYTINGVPLLAIDRTNKRVVVNETFFGTIIRPDVTSLGPTETVAMGTIHEAKLRDDPGFIIGFLLESQLIETYKHLEATVKLLEEKDSAQIFQASFSGSHVYYTNKRNEKTFAFRISIDRKTGEIAVSGGKE